VSGTHYGLNTLKPHWGREHHRDASLDQWNGSTALSTLPRLDDTGQRRTWTTLSG